MAYIQRRESNGKVRFIVRWPKADGPGSEHSRSFTKERPAIRFQHQVEHDIDHGGHQDERAGHLTLTAYTERWLARRVVSVGTLKNVEQDLRNFILPAMGSKRLDAITVATTQEFLASLARKTKANGQPYAEIYLRRIYSTFVSLLHAALDDGLITRLPLPRTSGLHPVLSEAVVLVPWQVDALVQAVEELNPRFAALTAFLFASGCRIGEAVALRHEDFTWPRRVIQDPAKRRRDQRQDDH